MFQLVYAHQVVRLCSGPLLVMVWKCRQVVVQAWLNRQHVLAEPARRLNDSNMVLRRLVEGQVNSINPSQTQWGDRWPPQTRGRGEVIQAFKRQPWRGSGCS